MPASSSADRRPLRALVLDFDGVIIESNDIKSEAFRAVFARFPEHLDTMMAFHYAHISDSRFVKFAHLTDELLGRRGDAVLQQELSVSFSRATLERLFACPLVPGAAAFLEEYAGRIPLYLASVTPAEDLEEILTRRALRRYFSGVYACPPWTKSEAIRDVMRQDSRAPSEVALIGDSPGDLRAARETGIEFIGRRSGIPFDPPAPPLHADLSEIGHVVRERMAP